MLEGNWSYNPFLQLSNYHIPTIQSQFTCSALFRGVNILVWWIVCKEELQPRVATKIDVSFPEKHCSYFNSQNHTHNLIQKHSADTLNSNSCKIIEIMANLAQTSATQSRELPGKAKDIAMASNTVERRSNRSDSPMRVLFCASEGLCF